MRVQPHQPRPSCWDQKPPKPPKPRGTACDVSSVWSTGTAADGPEPELSRDVDWAWRCKRAGAALPYTTRQRPTAAQAQAQAQAQTELCLRPGVLYRPTAAAAAAATGLSLFYLVRPFIKSMSLLLPHFFLLLSLASIASQHTMCLTNAVSLS